MVDENTHQGEYERDHHESWFYNGKRIFDEYQDMSLAHARNINQVALQAMQNAVETANMVAQQALKHEGHDPDQSMFRDLVKALALEIANDHKD